MKFVYKVSAAMREIDTSWNSSPFRYNRRLIITAWVRRSVSVASRMFEDYKATNPSQEDIDRNWNIRITLPTRNGEFYQLWVDKMDKLLLTWKKKHVRDQEG